MKKLGLILVILLLSVALSVVVDSHKGSRARPLLLYHAISSSLRYS